MEPKCCRLFDDEVMRNIMVSTGVAVMDYLRQRKGVDEDEVCDFVDANADVIITNTLEEMEDSVREEGESGDAGGG
jgi:hypothetical protein